ncbi:MAG TPA: hypothetical protein VNK04_04175 [Gemmataceae bacterium]|nr:hypothetical protein [Gemmataceae bacterium]
MYSRNISLGRWVLAGLAAMLVCGLAGCGEGGPVTHSVTGKVVFKDGNIDQLVGGRVEFQPLDNPDVLASADIQEDGSFSPVTLKDGKETPGLLPGTHRVCVFPPDEDEDEPLIIDRRFQDFTRSGLQCTVTDDGEITIEVTRPQRRRR